jgi:flagellar assembly protein FliH
MPVMKAQQSPSMRETAIVMDLSDLEREARQIVAGARAEATRLMTDGRAAAEREAQKIRETARAAGQKEGFDAGLAQGKKQGHDEAVAAVSAQLKDLTARWSQTLELLQQHMPTHIADAKTDVVKLALKIAQRVTHQEALRNRNVAAAVVEEALRAVGAGRQIAVHAHPSDVDALEQYLPDLLTSLKSIEEIHLQPDESAGVGGCFLRFGGGEIDARLDTQITRIAHELIGEDETPPASPLPPSDS